MHVRVHTDTVAVLQFKKPELSKQTEAYQHTPSMFLPMPKNKTKTKWHCPDSKTSMGQNNTTGSQPLPRRLEAFASIVKSGSVKW